MIESQIDRVERHRGDRTVWAFLNASFMDRQKLEKADLILRRPINPLPQRKGVPNSKITLAAE